ncbi:hypothetical protein HMPREF1548_06423 [Clostridium sp. KLE 1755]|nr:hypothetical protein HMPREF1548_06423 [Clostridium sp. KLE 1755]
MRPPSFSAFSSNHLKPLPAKDGRKGLLCCSFISTELFLQIYFCSFISVALFL